MKLYCSKCGTIMELRSGKYGQFHACKNAKCRSIMSKENAAKKINAAVQVGKLIDKKRKNSNKPK